MTLDLNKCRFYIISLKEDADRFNQTFDKLVGLGIDPELIEKIEAERKSQHHIGIVYSHSKAISKGLEKPGPFVILEDDVDINLSQLSFDIPDYTDALYLGLSSWGMKNSPPNFAQLGLIITDPVSGYPNVKRIMNMLSAHAICYISENYSKTLLDSLERSKEENTYYCNTSEVITYFGEKIVPCDITMANMQPNYQILGLVNPVFYQAGKHEYCTLIQI